MKSLLVLPVFVLASLFLAATAFSMAPDPPDPDSLAPFASDKCSLFPAGTIQDKNLWCDCCFEHDIDYWKGGTIEEREAADALLRDCVIEKTGDEALGNLMYLGVRAGGTAVFPTGYRWGYGWPYGRGYLPVTEEEQAVIEKRLEEYFASDNPYICED